MTLTPQDVANKEFLTVRLREGYDMQEVDDFLDEVENELRRLYEENERLRDGAPAGDGAAEPSPATEVDTADKVAGEARDDDSGAAASQHDAPEGALTILTHAQSAADNLISQAQARADELVTSATERAERMDADTEKRKAELLGQLKTEETDLRTRLDDLRAHEREYRSRLVAYHSEQIRRLQGDQADDVDVDVEQPVEVDQLGAESPAAVKP